MILMNAETGRKKYIIFINLYSTLYSHAYFRKTKSKRVYHKVCPEEGSKLWVMKLEWYIRTFPEKIRLNHDIGKSPVIKHI